MNQNGNLPSLTDRANSVNEWVQGLFSEEVWGYLKLSREDMKGLTAMDCGEIAAIMKQQACFIQLKLNKITACMSSYEYDLNSLLAPKMKDYDKYTKYEEKKFLAIRENEVLGKMSANLNELNQKKSALEFLSNRLDSYAMSLNELRRMKYGNPD